MNADLSTAAVNHSMRVVNPREMGPKTFSIRFAFCQVHIIAHRDVLFVVVAVNLDFVTISQIDTRRKQLSSSGRIDKGAIDSLRRLQNDTIARVIARSIGTELRHQISGIFRTVASTLELARVAQAASVVEAERVGGHEGRQVHIREVIRWRHIEAFLRYVPFVGLGKFNIVLDVAGHDEVLAAEVELHGVARRFIVPVLDVDEPGVRDALVEAGDEVVLQGGQRGGDHELSDGAPCEQNTPSY